MVERRSMAQRSRELLRSDALDIAEELVLGAGPRGLSMRELAGRVGVSRQTLYNEFGDRGGVAAALVLRCTDRFLDGIETALVGERDLHAAWAAAVGAALSETSTNPLIKALLTGEGAAPELFGADSGPIVVAATERSAAYMRRVFPDLDPDRIQLATETVSRLTVSHIVLPLHSHERVAEDVATVATRILQG